MVRLLIVAAIMCTSAYLAERHPKYEIFFYAIVVLTYTFFLGLRTRYNDTVAYVASFNGAMPLSEFLRDSDKMNVFHNPLFYGFASWFREITDNVHIYFSVVGLFDSILLVRFLKKHSHNHFAYSVLLFWSFGLGMLGAAAMKQITAMAILTLAFDALQDQKWIKFIIIVLVASLVHTYAILFLVMPMFMAKTWNWRTLIVIVGAGIIIMNFNSSIVSILDYADDLGKSVATNEVLDGISMNIFRVLVYAVPPALLLAFRHQLLPQMKTEQNLLANMSIISFMFVLMGRIQGANMFGRLASYFVMGDICLLGWILDSAFEKRTARLFLALSVPLFLGYYMYDYRNIYFESISLLEFVKSIF